MARSIKFTKMHGAGNDYIYINTLLYNIENPEDASRKWSACHTGIGSDGLVLIGKASDANADYSMRIFNADGSEAMMCGNASRCIGKYLFEKGITDKEEIRLETKSGIKVLRLNITEGKVDSVKVDMLEPRFAVKEQFIKPENGVVTAEGKEFRGTFVSMGNPHFVIFTDEMQDADVSKYGSALERNPAFPERCNIEFAHIMDNGDIRMRVWERGSGITMACGTGACATAVAAAHTGAKGRKSDIVMDGGSLTIEWSEDDNHVYMTGPAEFVFEGEIEI